MLLEVKTKHLFEMTAPTQLARLNVHPRDEFITFDEGPHIYTVHGKQGYTSVTTIVHQNFPHFDSEGTVNNILKGRKIHDPSYKYYGMTKEEILKMWADKGLRASTAGTKMHYAIECYYNGMDVKDDSVEFSYFKKFVADFPDLKPYRTEWMVYYEELKISGSIDMIFENPDGTLLIYDWKRCESIDNENDFGQYSATPCLSHLPHTNYWHYSLQLNIYKKILEEKYGKKVVGLYLVRIHPDSVTKTYERIEVADLDKEVSELFEERRQKLVLTDKKHKKKT